MNKGDKEDFLIHCDFSEGDEFISPEKIDKVLGIERDRFQKARKTYPDFVLEKLYTVNIYFKLPFPLKAKFMGTIERSNEEGTYKLQVVEIESGEHKGYFVRGEQLSVSTSHDPDPFYFCIPIYPELANRDPYLLTDRGVCWVYQDKHQASCHLILESWYKSCCQKGEIAEVIRKARKQVTSKIKEALNSRLDFSKLKKLDE